jgi:hypothetical protein
MSKYEIIFLLSKDERIILELEDPLTEIHCCYYAKTAFMQKRRKFFIGNDSVRNNILIFKDALEQALSNKLKLHKSITADVGYVYNEYLRLFYKDLFKVKSIFPYERIGEQEYWVGDRYHLWGYGARVPWIYNDSDDSIIFEVTPYYPGGFGNPKRAAKFTPYKQWIKKYKPYLIRIISRNVAQQWLDQCNTILNQIEENIKRLRAEKEKNNL